MQTNFCSHCPCSTSVLIDWYYVFNKLLLHKFRSSIYVITTVTMQAQREAPPDMMCRDKFLIQSTVVPVGTSDEDITASMVSVSSWS